MNLDQPMLVARSADISVIAEADHARNPMTDAQLWSTAEGYSAVRPLAVHLKFLYYIELVDPPAPWTEPA